jgi:hypothetical protein
MYKFRKYKSIKIEKFQIVNIPSGDGKIVALFELKILVDPPYTHVVLSHLSLFKDKISGAFDLLTPEVNAYNHFGVKIINKESVTLSKHIKIYFLSEAIRMYKKKV